MTRSHGATVSAVVVNFNGGENVLRCLRHLLDSRTAFARIVVVDNASTDGSRDRIAGLFPQVAIIDQATNEGPAQARNAGLAAVDTELALLIDDDVYLSPEALGLMLEAQTDTSAAVVVPRILLFPDTDCIQCDGASAHYIGTMRLRHGFENRQGVPAQRAEVGAIISACLLVDRQTALACGGFDEIFFFYFEDLEFGLRLRSLGHTLICEARAVAWHDRGAGTPGLSFRGSDGYPARRAYLSHRNRWLSMLIHYRARSLLVLTPVFAVYELLTLAFFIRGGWPMEWVRAWRWLFRHRAEIGSRRASMRSRRQRPDRELLEGGSFPWAPSIANRLPVRWVVSAFSRLANLYFVAWRRVM